MGMKLDLLKSLPTVIRDPKLLEARRQVKINEGTHISCLFGEVYFDGDRSYGYGGYYKDDRWIPVAKDIISHYGLHPDAKLFKNFTVLDVGCAKGYLVEALLDLGVDAYGIDVSKYAVQNCSMDMVGRIHCGNILYLPFPDNSFDLVLGFAVLHNIDEKLLHLAFKEVQRVSKGPCFITVDSYYNEKQKQEFEAWCLTAKSYGPPSYWLDMFEQCNYIGDYGFIIHEFSDEE